MRQIAVRYSQSLPSEATVDGEMLTAPALHNWLIVCNPSDEHPAEHREESVYTAVTWEVDGLAFMLERSDNPDMALAQILENSRKQAELTLRDLGCPHTVPTLEIPAEVLA